MPQTQLHIFAVNTDISARHTYLSRSKGETSELPDLAGWLSLRQGGLNTDEIELFPVSDLGDLTLASYVSNAFDLSDNPLTPTVFKLNALDGHVLLVPDAALAGNWKAGQNLTLVDSLPLAVPDNTAEPLETEAASYGQPSQDDIGWHAKKKTGGTSGWAVVIFLAALLVIVIATSVLMAT